VSRMAGKDEEEEEPTGFAYIGGVLESIQQQNEEVIRLLASIESLLKTPAPAPPLLPAPTPTPQPAAPPAAAPPAAETRKPPTLSEMAKRLKEKEEQAGKS